MSVFCGNTAAHGAHAAESLGGQRCIGNLPRPVPGGSLAEKKAELERLAREVRELEDTARAAWNERLEELAAALEESGAVSHWRTRKNERVAYLKCGPAELAPPRVHFGFLEEGRGAWLQVRSSDGYALEWDTAKGVPDAEKFLRVVWEVCNA